MAKENKQTKEYFLTLMGGFETMLEMSRPDKAKIVSKYKTQLEKSNVLNESKLHEGHIAWIRCLLEMRDIDSATDIAQNFLHDLDLSSGRDKNEMVLYGEMLMCYGTARWAKREYEHAHQYILSAYSILMLLDKNEPRRCECEGKLEMINLYMILPADRDPVEEEHEKRITASGGISLKSAGDLTISQAIIGGHHNSQSGLSMHTTTETKAEVDNLIIELRKISNELLEVIRESRYQTGETIVSLSSHHLNTFEN